MNRLRFTFLKAQSCLLAIILAGCLNLLVSPLAHALTASASSPSGDDGYVNATKLYTAAYSAYVDGPNYATYSTEYSILDFPASNFNVVGTLTGISNLSLTMYLYNPSATAVSGTIGFWISGDTTDSVETAGYTVTAYTTADPVTGCIDGLASASGTSFAPNYLIATTLFTPTTSGPMSFSLPLSGTVQSMIESALSTSGTIRIIVAPEDPNGNVVATFDNSHYESGYPNLSFNYTSSLASLVWSGTGSWDNSTANWHSGSASTVWNPTAQAIFSGSGAGPGTLTLAAPIISDGGLNFSVGGYTISGTGANTLAMDGTGAGGNFIITSDTVTSTTISALLSGTAGINKLGSGGLSLTNTGNTFTGGVTITSGTLYINSDLELGDSSNYVDLAETTGTSSLAITSSVTLGASRDIYGSGNIDVYPGQVLDITGAVGPLLGAAPAGEFYLVDSGTVIFDGTSINPNTISVSSSSTLIMNTPMTTPSAATLYYIEFTNDGYVYLNADNTSFAGRFDTVAGSKVTLVLGNANALGENQMYLNGGTIKAAAPYLVPTPASFSGTTTYSGADMEWSGQFTMYYESYSPQFKVYDHMTLDDGIILTGGTTNVDVQDRLIKSGTGTLTLLSSENEMSDLLLYNGTVEVGPSGNLGVGFVTGSSAVTLSATTTNATLLLDNADALDEITDNVIILNSATTSGIVDLNFASSGYDYINSITVNGTSYPSGVYNSTNLPGTLTGSGNLVIAPGGIAGYGTWQIDNFGSNASNIAISGPTANPAGDGVSNLMKYALDLNPNAPIVSGTFLTTGTTGTGLPIAAFTSGTLSLTYTQLVTPGDITYVTESSTDLVVWSPTGVTETILSSTTDSVSSAPIQTVQDSVAMSGTVGFIRLYVMQTNGTTVSSSPRGFISTYCSGTSDTIVSIPFVRPTEYAAGLSSVSGSNVLILSGSALMTPGQFVYSGTQLKTYYALVGSATSGTTGKEGCFYTITANGTNSLTLNLNGDSISALATGEQISVVPYLTFNYVFPASGAGTEYRVSTSTRTSGLQTEVLTPNYTATGVNLAPSGIYFYYNSAWRLFGDSATVDHGNDTLPPNSYYVMRNPAGVGSTTFTPFGNVVTKTLNINLTTLSTGQQDDQVALVRPIPVSLNNLGLISSGVFASSTSSRTSGLTDELLTFTTGATGFNLAPTSIYYYYNSAWRLFGDSSTVDHGGDVIQPGSGVIIRKAKGTGATQFWKNTATYQ